VRSKSPLVNWALTVSLGLAGCRGELDRVSQKRGAAEAARTEQLGVEAAVVLDRTALTRIGLRTVALVRSNQPPEMQLAALVIEDPGAASAVRTGIGGRLAEPEGRTWPRIGERLQAGTEIARVGDALPLAVPRGGTVTRILAQPGELVQAGQALLELTDYTAPVARVVWVPGAPPPPPTLSLAPLEGGARLRARLEGPAAQADPLTGGPAYLYRLSARAGNLRPGATLIAFLPDPGVGTGGVAVPSSAVVQWEALAWVYVEREPGRFVRVRVPTDHPIQGGWRVSQGLTPGDRVVVRGAGQLLSEEFRARIVVGEEVGE
jgi:multidrug efflux pump subunit AcrA (membrane-fusion protein)